MVTYAASNSKTDLLHLERARQNRLELLVPLKDAHLSVRERECRGDSRRQVSLTIQREHNDQRTVLDKVGVVELRRCLFGAHQMDRLFQLAIPDQAESGYFQSGPVDFIRFGATSAEQAERQDPGNEKPPCDNAPPVQGDFGPDIGWRATTSADWHSARAQVRRPRRPMFWSRLNFPRSDHREKILHF